MTKIATIVLAYNTPDLTDALVTQLRADHIQPYVIQNGNWGQCPKFWTYKLKENLGFFGGMHFGLQVASTEDSYDAYWFLNSDIVVPAGTLRRVAEALEDPTAGQASPCFNSPHPHMMTPGDWPFLEPTATLIKASTIDRIGFWDAELAFGWGTDFDYGYRVRQAGLRNVVTTARILHLEHQSYRGKEHEYFSAAGAEMDRVLVRKYGSAWRCVLGVSQ